MEFCRSLSIPASLLIISTVLGQSNEDALVSGQNGWTTHPKVTVGETITGWSPPGKMDGIGARRVGANVEIFMNHEVMGTEGSTYTLANGLQLKGARITRFLMDAASRTVISAGLAYDRIYDRTGNEATIATKINEGSSSLEGVDRLCSASLYEAGTFNLEDDLFVTGEEAPNGQGFILDVDNGDLYAAPWLGRAKWENGTFIQPVDPGHVMMLIGDDTEAAPLYLFVGEKDHFGGNTFLDRNGLAFGTLHVFVSSDGFTSPQHVNGTGTRFNGSFQPIAHYNAALAGTSGYDALGFADQNKQYALGNAIGMFRFSRPEDLATDPYDHTRIVYASTGRGHLFPADDWGTTYIIDIDPTDLSAEVNIIYDGDDAGNGQFPHPDHGLRSPDNVDWADDGSIYIQEDEATYTNSFGGTSGMEASIWKLDPFSGQLTRIGMVDRSATLPDGQYDTAPSDLGNWETSGIVDVTHLFDVQDRVLLLATVQAQSILGSAINSGSLVSGGQFYMIEGPVQTNLVVSVKALLQGAYDPGTGMMRDDLRQQQMLPLQQPYNIPPYAYTGSEQIDTAHASKSGADAIVDWVLIELRDAQQPAQIVARRAALIQRDGDIVDVDGSTPVRFTNMAAGQYHIAIRHRNHLGVMTAGALQLGPVPAHIDLTSAAIPTYGVDAQAQINGKFVLWSGDVNNDGSIKYTGMNNDRDRILLEIGGTVPTNIVSGYEPGDLDLNGNVKYTGGGNDRDLILNAIGGVIPTVQRLEQLP